MEKINAIKEAILADQLAMYTDGLLSTPSCPKLAADMEEELGGLIQTVHNFHGSISSMDVNQPFKRRLASSLTEVWQEEVPAIKHKKSYRISALIAKPAYRTFSLVSGILILIAVGILGISQITLPDSYGLQGATIGKIGYPYIILFALVMIILGWLLFHDKKK